MPVKRDFGLTLNRLSAKERGRMIAYINIKLASLGLGTYTKEGNNFVQLSRDLIENYREKSRLLGSYLPPVDKRIQDFLNGYLSDTSQKGFRLPSTTLVLDRYGMARELSMPPQASKYCSPTLSSYRIRNGILHNPANDRRTTQGVFHISEGGLPIPPDKKAVPKDVFARLLAKAFEPPKEMLKLPFTAEEEKQAFTFLSLYIRPIVCPEVPGLTRERSSEIRFFAPASLAANIDFVESIFGNSGDPYIPENDAGLDPLHWTGHSGCIILATHLTTIKKIDLGLPKYEDATERQKRDGMCYKNEAELYNEGKPFKICARDAQGVMITVIADNYFGYSKKEVKTHISYSANLMGIAEEEHSGGALVMPSYNQGTRFMPDTNLHSKGHTFETMQKVMGDRVDVKPEGYAVDKKHPHIVYLKEDAIISLEEQRAMWTHKGKAESLRILPNEIYLHPTGYRIQLGRHGASGAWRLVGTVAEGVLCHKPFTVSGGGKSEISKSIWDAITYSPVIIGDFADDMAQVKAILEKHHGSRFKDEKENTGDNSRSILSEKRSLGSVIKLLSPSPLYKDDYNTWLKAIPERIKALVFLVKRFYRPEWGTEWSSHFSVDVVNGTTGNVFKFEGRPILGSYLRVGYTEDGLRYTLKLRQDFMPAEKIQWEDDISASAVVPVEKLVGMPEWMDQKSVKFCKNCEARFFQRPDDAIIRGYDKQAEADMSRQDNFISNFEPLSKKDAQALVEKTVTLSEYTDSMRKFIEEMANDEHFEYFVLSSQPRIVDGAPSKNPRYLQLDPNNIQPIDRYLSDVSSHLYRKLDINEIAHQPVGAVLPGRRNNPPDLKAGIRPLAVYGPIHYQELPELFMDFVCSLTGKSPSTTGAGSEGALTKGPFNALVPTTDLSNTLLGFILSGYPCFSSAAGHIGHKYKVDHDVSLLMPELFSRLTPQERDPEFLIQNGYLEKLEDFTYKGKLVPAGRLGYRITELFMLHFFGRIFDTPAQVFPLDMLKPEMQNMDNFVDGVYNIAEAQKKVAQEYIDDGSINAAIPPLKAILSIMATGSFEGKSLIDAEVRKLFTKDYVLASDWYKERLIRYRDAQVAYLEKSLKYIERSLTAVLSHPEEEQKELRTMMSEVTERLATVKSDAFLKSLVGTIGTDPLFR